MAYTPVQVCNLALAEVGDEAAQITSLPATAGSEYSKEANLCSKFYEPSLHEVLRMHTWNCAKRRAKLARLSTTPVSGWAYEFQLPADCARPLEVTSSNTTERAIQFNTEWVIEGRTVRSNKEDLWILYIQNMADLTAADSLFVKVLYTTLATKLVYPLTENRNLAKDIRSELENVVLPDARRVNSFEGHENAVIDSEWIESSYNGFSGNLTSTLQFDAGYGTI